MVAEASVRRNCDLPEFIHQVTWVVDLKQNTKSQLTFGSFSNTMPAWSPDDKLLAFSSNRQNGVVDIFRQPSGIPQSEEVLLQSPLDKFVVDWSPDGQYLLYAQVDGRIPTGGIQASLMALPLHGEAKPTQLVKWPLFDNAAAFLRTDIGLLLVRASRGRSRCL